MKLYMLLVFVIALATAKAEEKLLIEIFIESFCTYSKQFICNQFRPAYENIKNEVVVRFYTFGKSKSFINEKGEIEFECQHGEKECEWNKIQTCGLDKIGANQDLQAQFIICTMCSLNKAECVESLDLSFDDIQTCANGTLGTELQLKMEEASAIIKTAGHVPLIKFDGDYNVALFYKALDGIEEVVQSLIET